MKACIKSYYIFTKKKSMTNVKILNMVNINLNQCSGIVHEALKFICAIFMADNVGHFHIWLYDLWVITIYGRISFAYESETKINIFHY